MVLILIVILAFLLSCIKIVPQADEYVIEFLGSYQTTWSNGLHFKIPILQRIAKKVSMKEQVKDFPPQPVITRDNVTMQIDTVVYYNVLDAELYTYGVENPIMALANLSATTLRNVIGEMELDQTLTSRDVINAKMQQVLDEATDKWGIKVNRVELKNIMPPAEIQDSMEKQMKAEREKRQTLLEAEAHKASSITRAQGDKEAMILHAEAERDAAIATAMGKAESIRLVYEAQAKGLEMLSSIKMTPEAIQMRQLETLKALGDGQATKIIVPTNLAESAGNLAYVGESLNITKDINKTAKHEGTTVVEDPCCDDEDRTAVTKEFNF